VDRVPDQSLWGWEKNGSEDPPLRVRKICDQGVGVFAEKFGGGVRDSGEFLAGHGMAAKEERAISPGKSSSAAWAMRTLVLQASVTRA